MREGALKDAGADFNRAIELDPGYAQAYANRGVLESKEGKVEESIADFRRASELRPRPVVPDDGRGISMPRVARPPLATGVHKPMVPLRPMNAASNPVSTAAPQQ